MMSLFSNFDLMFFQKFNWIFIITMLSFMNVTCKNSYNNFIFKKLIWFFENFFNSLSKNLTKGFLQFMISIMLSILLLNVASILPWNFPLTSQISVILFLSITFWTSIEFFYLGKNFKMFFIHTIPEGCPIYLFVVLFLIEIISNSIRPITLMVRLVANILAGHLLLNLLFSLISIFPIFSPTFLILNTIEIFVALIQTYIFVTMITLYYSEIS